MEANKSVDIHISKKVLIITLAILVLVLMLLMVWQFGGFTKLKPYVVHAQTTVTVTDKRTNKPVAGATVIINGKKQVTDASGKAVVTSLTSGEFTLSIDSDNYKPLQQSLTLKRGDNPVMVALETKVEFFNASGTVKNAISEEVVGGVTVTTKSGPVSTDGEGKFQLADVQTGDLEITLEKSGFEKKTAKVTLVKDEPVNLTLYPSGRVVFVSNRDAGKRGLYSSNYDGSDIKQIVKRSEDTEDYGVIASPDGNKLLFLSTREKRRITSDTQYEPSLYLVNTNGDNLIQLSKGFRIRDVSWSNSNKYVSWLAGAGEKEYNNNLYIYTLDSKQTTKLNDNGSANESSFNHKGTAIAWEQDSGSGDPNAGVGLFYRDLSKKDNKQIGDKNPYAVAFSDDDSKIQYTYYDNGSPRSQQYTIANQKYEDYTPAPGTKSDKVTSPDGRHYAYTQTRDGKTDVFVSNSDGNNEKRLTNLGTVTGQPRWDSSNSYLMFDSEKTGETAKYIVAMTGAPARKVTDVFLEKQLHSEGGP